MFSDFKLIEVLEASSPGDMSQENGLNHHNKASHECTSLMCVLKHIAMFKRQILIEAWARRTA